MKNIILLLLSVSALIAELPPQVYDKLKNSAQEILTIKVTNSKINLKNNTMYIFAKAKIIKVIRSKNHLKSGENINIVYSKPYIVNSFIVGPSIIVTLKKDKNYKVFLDKMQDGNYTAAARGKSFRLITNSK